MRHRLPWALALAGAALVVTGVVVFAAGGGADPGSAGWFAYEPLPVERPHDGLPAFDDGSVLWSGQQLLGAALVLPGLLLLAVAGGWLLGRRAARPLPSAA